MVWTTKRRRKALTLPHEREYCDAILRRVADEYGMFIGASEVDLDHVHLYVEIPPQMSIGRAVATLKSVSAREMFRRFGYLKKQLWSGQMWSPSYFVRSVGEGVTAEMVKKYITEHEEKSSLRPVQAELFPGPQGRGIVKRRT